jgi:hypothetical protein
VSIIVVGAITAATITTNAVAQSFYSIRLLAESRILLWEEFLLVYEFVVTTIHAIEVAVLAGLILFESEAVQAGLPGSSGPKFAMQLGYADHLPITLYYQKRHCSHSSPSFATKKYC